MEPQKVAAQFAAYVWCVDGQQKAPKEAARFARESWRAFLPIAHEGLGRLLIRVASLDEPVKGTSTKGAAQRMLKRRKRVAAAVQAMATVAAYDWLAE